MILKIGFAATDCLAVFKLIDAGVSKDNIMIIQTFLLVAKVILSLVVGKVASGPKPLSIFLKTMPIR